MRWYRLDSVVEAIAVDSSPYCANSITAPISLRNNPFGLRPSMVWMRNQRLSVHMSKCIILWHYAPSSGLFSRLRSRTRYLGPHALASWVSWRRPSANWLDSDHWSGTLVGGQLHPGATNLSGAQLIMVLIADWSSSILQPPVCPSAVVCGS